MIDFHVHLAGSGCCQSGIVLSNRFRRRPSFLALRLFQDVTSKQINTDIDEIWVARIAKLVSESVHTKKAVVLCFAAVHNEAGEVVADKTQLYVPNSWGVASVAKNPDHFFLGGSVHPYQKNAVEELHALKAQGVFLIKWLPSAMGIDPNSSLCDPFYDALVELKIPLLSHADTEYTFAAAGPGWMEKNDVSRLERALKKGVKVIAAHGGTPSQLQDVELLTSKYKNLYADTSGLFNPTRARVAPELFARAKQGVLGERLLFGTDWPVPAFPSLLLDKIGLSKWREVGRVANPFDRDLALKELLGFEKERFVENEKRFLEELA